MPRLLDPFFFGDVASFVFQNQSSKSLNRVNLNSTPNFQRFLNNESTEYGRKEMVCFLQFSLGNFGKEWEKIAPAFEGLHLPVVTTKRMP